MIRTHLKFGLMDIHFVIKKPREYETNFEKR